MIGLSYTVGICTRKRLLQESFGSNCCRTKIEFEDIFPEITELSGKCIIELK